jgi:hypothetical protein
MVALVHSSSRVLFALTAAVVSVVVTTASSCGPTVNCENLCQRTLACEVTFAAPDDPDGERVESGERTELESCVLGCDASPLVSVETATCVDGVDTGDAAACQDDVLSCLGVDGGT